MIQDSSLERISQNHYSQKNKILHEFINMVNVIIKKSLFFIKIITEIYSMAIYFDKYFEWINKKEKIVIFSHDNLKKFSIFSIPHHLFFSEMVY